MNQKVIIADDFYDVAHQYRLSFFEKNCLITEETLNKISHILNQNVSVIEASNEVCFGNVKGQITANIQADWIAIIYLTLPPDCVSKQGLKFYTHKKTRLDSFPNKYAMDMYGWKTIEDLEKSFNVFNLEDWEEYMNVFVKYNRLILFRGDYWHSYGNGFGGDLNTSMIYQKILLKNG